ncbi:MAG: DUF3990 domain-containing protein [Eggerthellaceae bacterium]|nr:DUF3990 domain-containing protein [Eggerthellaceae bacterium]
MELYHGSENVVEAPQFGVGKLHNDYGLGFYCTEHEDMAKEWAVGFDHDGYANRYTIDLDGLRIVDLDGDQYCTLHWLATLLQNRWFDVRSPIANEARSYLIEHFSVDFSDADVIEGYRADDSYFTFAQDFISGSISYRQLRNAMQLGSLGRQVTIRSERAFSRLVFLGSTRVERSIWLPRREQRDRDARNRYFDIERNARRKGDLLISQIIDEEMGPGDDRLR